MSSPVPTLPAGLVARVRGEFLLDRDGIHGAGHWARVAFHGRALAMQLGVDPRIPQLFGLLHDSQRRHDGRDRDHGPRAAEFVERLHRERLIPLSGEALGWLVMACHGHSDGHRDAPLAVQVCWDADRLDLGRIGIRPDPSRLCAAPARNPAMIERAWRWSLGGARRPQQWLTADSELSRTKNAKD